MGSSDEEARANGRKRATKNVTAASMEPPRPPSVTQAGGTQTNPTPSGGGGYTKWEGHEQPLPLGGGGGTHSGRDVYLKGNAI